MTFINRRTDDHGQVDEGICCKAPTIQAGQHHNGQDQLRPVQEVRQDRKGRRAVPGALWKSSEQVQMRNVREVHRHNTKACKKDQTKEVQQ